MLINLSEIMSVKDRIEHVKAEITLKKFILNGIEYEISECSPLNLEITHLNNKKVLIEGEALVVLNIPCSRCLTPVRTVFEIHVNRKLDFNDSDDKRIEDLDETNFVNGYNLDIDILIYDEILIDFPMKVLCDENCKGICNVCGRNLNEGKCECESISLDPRMSVIQDIFNNSK